MREKIALWLKKQVKSAGAKGVVLGLSGGLDSCVVAALARQALGSKRVLALILPCHSDKRDALDAALCARTFGIRTRTIDLSRIYDALLAALPGADRMTKANLRPRLRMLVLYYFARKLGFLVCGTSNKSELMAGYFTKFGDGASDILPLGGLTKTRVRQLAVMLQIPPALIDKAPTAGLWPGQTDEQEIGLTYVELDDILTRMEQGRRQVASRKKVAQVKRMIALSAHKRRRPAACEF